MTDLQVTLALIQVGLFAVSAAVLVYCHMNAKRIDDDLEKALSECQTNAEKCINVAKVLEASHNATTEAIKRLDTKVDDMNHKMLATSISRAMPGAR